MYANVNLISHTKLVCENVVFSEPCYLENKCGVEKAFYFICKAMGQFGFLRNWANASQKCFWFGIALIKLGYEPTR
jgi:hypothetical protein